MTWEVVRLGAVGSTNDEAAARARDGAPHGTCLVAEEQTKGRGTKGRTWWSPRGGLYLSVILRLELAPSAMPPLTLAAGVGVCDACRALGADAVLKWPNDVLAGGRKLAGILVEAASRGDRVEYAILGVGLNHEPERALPVLLPELERAVGRFVDEGAPAVVRAFKERCPMLGRPIRVREGDAVIEGILGDIADDGALVVDDRRIVSGEIVA